MSDGKRGAGKSVVSRRAAGAGRGRDVEAGSWIRTRGRGYTGGRADEMVELGEEM